MSFDFEYQPYDPTKHILNNDQVWARFEYRVTGGNWEPKSLLTGDPTVWFKQGRRSGETPPWDPDNLNQREVVGTPSTGDRVLLVRYRE